MTQMINGGEEYKSPFLDLNNLFDGYMATLKSKPHKRGNIQYGMNLMLNLLDLKDSLENMTYVKEHNKPFSIFERGKTRIIQSSQVNHRIVGHVWWDNLLRPQILPKLTDYNCASLKGRGTAYFRESLKSKMKKFYRTYGDNDGYFLSWDISKYFDNLDHKILYKRLKPYMHCELELWLLKTILNSFKHDVSWMSDEEYEKAKNSKFDSLENFGKSNEGTKFLYKGVSIGDLESQGFGIIYLDPVDHMLEQDPSVFWSGRYMDDFGCIVRNKEDIPKIQKKVKDMVEIDLKLYLNQKKTQVHKLSQKFSICKRHYRLTDTGEVIEQIDKKNFQKQIQKMRDNSTKIVDDDKTRKEERYKYLTNETKSWYGENKPILNKNQRTKVVTLAKEFLANYNIKTEMVCA